MNKWIKAIISLSLIIPSWAEAGGSRPLLDKVMFQLSAKQWVKTQTALLSVNLNATLTNPDLVKARADIMAQLNQIAKGDWHLLQFDRSQDSSGMEKLYVMAQARIDQAQLTGIYQNARSVSKPGANYSISAVEFRPSLEEIQQVRNQLRESLYQQVKAEMGRLNQVYSDQHYSLSKLYFVDGSQPVAPPAMRTKEMNMMAMAAAPAPDLQVSQELVMSAVAVVASNRSPGAKGA